jgi:streptogramin lyase
MMRIAVRNRGRAQRQALRAALCVAALFAVTLCIGLGGAAQAAGSATRVRTLVTAKVPMQPIQIAPGFGSMWALTDDGSKSALVRFSRTTGRRIHTLALGPPTVGPTFDEGALALTSHAIWVAKYWENTVYEIDPSSYRIEQRIRVGVSPQSTAVGYGSVWVANTSSGSVTRINAANADITATIPIGFADTFNGGPVYLTTGQGGVWATVPSKHAVLEISPRSNQVVRTITTTAAALCGRPTLTGSSLWLNGGLCGGGVARIDLNSGRTTFTRGFPTYYISDLSARAGSVWIVDDLKVDPNTGVGSNAVLMRLDATTGRLQATYSLGRRDALFGPYFFGGQTWVGDFFNPDVRRLDLSITGPVAASAVAAALPSTATAEPGAQVSPNSTRGRFDTGPQPGIVSFGLGHLWLTQPLDGDIQTPTNALERIDPRTGVVRRFAPGLAAVNAVTADGSVWISKYYNDQVWRLDPSTGRLIAAIAVSLQPEQLTFYDGHIWVCNHHGHAVSEINPRTNRVIRTINVGLRQFFVGPNDVFGAAGAIWVHSINLGRYQRINPATGRVVATLAAGLQKCTGPAPAQPIWEVVDQKHLQRIDPATNAICTVAKTTGLFNQAIMTAGRLWVVGDLKVTDPDYGLGKTAFIDERDLRTGALNHRTLVGPPSSSADSAVAAQGRFWLADARNGVIRSLAIPTG